MKLLKHDELPGIISPQDKWRVPRQSIPLQNKQVSDVTGTP